MRANGFSVSVFADSAELLAALRDILPEGADVALGNSVTLDETGLRALVSSGGYVIHDAACHGEKREEALRAGLDAGYYFCSAAAITEKGELLIVDGTGNRVSAVSFGAKRVFIIVGRNKLVADMEQATERLRCVAAPKNALRRGKAELPCAVTGICHDCKSSARMCCYELRLRFCRIPGRINVLIVDEELGY